jgi:hypothetical protein
MRWYRKGGGSLDDMFPGDGPPAREVSRRTVSETYVLTLYRGFDFDPDEVEVRDGKYVLSPKKSEQGMMWFAHGLQRTDASPIDYVSGRGGYVLEYPLEVRRFYDLVEMDDGSERVEPPQGMDFPDPTRDQRIMCSGACYELPEGFVFSYKTEKFVGCTRELLVDPSMVRRDVPGEGALTSN